MMHPWYNREIADTAMVCRIVARALLEGRPCASITICDGESASLWAGKGFATWHYLAGYGVPYNEFEETAAQMAAAIPRADIVCVPLVHRTYGSKVRESLALWDVQLKPTAVVGDAMVVFFLLYDMWLWGLIQGRKVLCINNQADKMAGGLLAKTAVVGLADYVAPQWIQVADAFAVMLEEGQAGTRKALDECASLPVKPDIALLGAGARAAHIAVSVAEMHSIPVIELGSICDYLHSPWNPEIAANVYQQYLREG